MTLRPTRLSELLSASRVKPIAAIEDDPMILGASLDSRRTEPGNLFFALRGLQEHGTDYVPSAVRRGALAVVADTVRPDDLDPDVAWVQVREPRIAAGLLARECYGRPDEAMALVGITGTNGKTTVAHLVESIARAAGRPTGRIGTTGYAWGGHEQPLERTTPEAPDLYCLLDRMRDDGVELVAMEVSSHALALHRVAGARFAVAAFLNLSRDHLDFHRTDTAYFEAKASLFETLSTESTAVLPADSPLYNRLVDRTRARILTFGRSATADVRLSQEHSSLEGSSAVLESSSGKLPIRTFLLGRYNLDNVAAATACALALGIPPESVASGVLELERIPGRMDRVDRGQAFHVIVDYAHTAAALDDVLRWLRDVSEGRVIVVFGCGGDRDDGKRVEMGRIAAERADHVVVTSDNPRHEDPQRIASTVVEGVARVAGGGARCDLILDRREAIRVAVGMARHGDVVLIAGKGHETTQTIGEKSLPFDDRSVAAEALADRAERGDGVAGA